MNTSCFPIAMLAVLYCLSATAIASTKIPSNELMIATQNLSLCSDTKIYAYGLIKVGHSALYMKNCENRKKQFFDKNKMISFYYERDIPKHAFVKSTLKMLERNLEPQNMEKWRSEIIEFNDNYQDITNGDQYDICFIKGQGLSLYLNNKLIASHESDEFAALYFNIWFGEKPFNKSMKKKLM